MQQSNALRRLDNILTEALDSGNPEHPSGPILLKAMKLAEKPENIIFFYELLSKAQEEARSIKNERKIDRYLRKIEELNKHFCVNNAWSTKWTTFVGLLEQRGILVTIDALANYYYSQNPVIFLEGDLLANLKSEFNSLSEKILESELSKDLKKFLTDRIDEILKAIRRYHIDGTEGLEKAAKSLIGDLVLKEHSLKVEEKNNPIYKRVQAWVLSILFYITPSPYDIIGAVPDIHNFWIHKFKDLVAVSNKIEEIIIEALTIQEAVEKASNIINESSQKSLPGKELKALPASREN